MTEHECPTCADRIMSAALALEGQAMVMRGQAGCMVDRVEIAAALRAAERVDEVAGYLRASLVP